MKFRYKAISYYTIILASFMLGMIVIVMAGLLHAEKDPMAAFAQCLTHKNATMYGTDWCPYCQNQKKLFGHAFEHIKYVNCDFNQQLCKQKGVRAYPVWYIGEETQPPGIITLSQLSSLTGCTTPFTQPSV